MLLYSTDKMKRLAHHHESRLDNKSMKGYLEELAENIVMMRDHTQKAYTLCNSFKERQTRTIEDRRKMRRRKKYLKKG